MNRPMPVFLRRRAWWLLPLLAWGMAMGLSLRSHLAGMERQGLDLAAEEARSVFRMVALARAWNAGHGGVYVPVTEQSPPNTYLDHPLRDLTTSQGMRLTMINPAYMTRQMSERLAAEGGPGFRLTSLRPIRPGNVPDAWERAALEAFERGSAERIEVVAGSGGRTLRYMAPLKVEPTCLACHAAQGYKVGDVRGGVSVSLPYAGIEAGMASARRQEFMLHGAIFLAIGLPGWVLLELLRRRWADLGRSVEELESVRTGLVTENKALIQARDQAEAASRAKSDFLATVSHEARTPLNGILGMAALLRGSRLDPEQKAHVETLHRSATGLLALLTDVLEFTRLESTPPREEHIAFDPSWLLGEIGLRFRPQAAAKSLRLQLDDRLHEPLRLYGAPAHLRRILAKLVDNAIKFTDQGRITVGLDAEPRPGDRVRLRFTVADSGIGMTPETMARLFRPFEVADTSATRRHPGLGLGLAICKRLAEGIGGGIKVASQPGTGSTFILGVELPRAAAESVAAAGDGIDPLLALLEQDDIAALDAYAQLSAELRARMGERFTGLDVFMARFDFRAAATVLREWLRQARADQAPPA